MKESAETIDRLTVWPRF